MYETNFYLFWIPYQCETLTSIIEPQNERQNWTYIKGTNFLQSIKMEFFHQTKSIISDYNCSTLGNLNLQSTVITFNVNETFKVPLGQLGGLTQVGKANFWFKTSMVNCCVAPHLKAPIRDYLKTRGHGHGSTLKISHTLFKNVIHCIHTNRTPGATF